MRWMHSSFAERGASSGAEEVATALREVAGRVKSVVYTSIERGGTGAKGARLILDDVYALMSGTSLAGSELAPALAHSKSLLYGDQPLDSRLEPLLPLDPDAVLAGRYRNLEQAFAYRLDRDDYVGAKALLEIAQVSNPDTASSLQPLYLEALLPARARVRALGEQTAATLDRARRQLYVTEDDYAKLSGRLARSIDPERLDVDREMADLMNMANELSANKDSAIERFLSAPVVADLRANNVEFARRVDALIGEGDLATATELVQLAERGEDLAGADRDSFDISSFFPVVPDALVSGINAAMVDAARKRLTFGLLDFSKLNEDAAEQVGKALAAWRAFSSGNGISDMLGTLKPVLRLLGIEAGAEDRRALLGVTSSPQRRWFDLSGVVVTGKALLPFFGSQSMGRLRCLWVTGSPAAETLTEWIEQDLARVPVVVFHTGTMTAESRLAFTRTMRKREGRPVVVVDDAVVGWLASLGQFRFEPLMQATLPFSAGNPYLPPSGDCPVELFYGRAAHVAAVQAAAGTCLVYGGRQLGKSALLRTAQREFNRVANQVAVYIDLKAPIESSRNPEAVWAELATKLIDARVMEQPRGVLRDPAGRVISAVTDWLDEDETRRLLVLLDEADLYFDLDAQRNFVTTSRLKDLMDTRGRRFKVVWAGLHQVGRFATVSNHPIAHLGAPAVIGPLEPGPAYRLIEVPCAALGLQFESDALVNRILAYCNYQPVLLHLFGRALVQRLCMRSSSDLDSLPITVSEAEIEEIAGSAALQQAVRERLRLTLELDPRYKVITYSATYEAHIRGFDIALSASELRAASERWWAAGFAGVDASEFRSLLEELVGLGVLSADPDGGGWRLRSANVLRLLGTLEQVEDSLLEEEEREPTALESSEIRDYLGGAHSSPITRAQLADLMGTRANQVRLVVGSAATGADNLHEALVQAATSPPVRFTLSAPRKRAEFMRALEDGGTEHHRVVFSDLRTVNPETCAESLEAALAITPWIGSRSVILLVDARTIAWWMPYLAPDNHAPGLEVMSLRRFDRRSLRAWSSGHEAVFQDEESRSKLLALTGGWPALIERASGLAGEGRTTTAVLTELEAIIQSDASIDKLLVATMKSVPPPLSDLYTIMAEAPEVAMSADDLALVAEGTYADPRILVEAMRALQVISVTEQGELVAEPVMARAWLARGQAERDIDTGV